MLSVNKGTEGPFIVYFQQNIQFLFNAINDLLNKCINLSYNCSGLFLITLSHPFSPPPPSPSFSDSLGLFSTGSSQGLDKFIFFDQPLSLLFLAFLLLPLAISYRTASQELCVLL